MNQIQDNKIRTAKKGLLLLTTALLLAAVLILTNVLVAALPDTGKKIDVTSDKMFSVTNSTKREVAKTELPVSIYLISVNGEDALADEGIHLHTFLSNLAAVSKKISYSVIDPMKDPDFLSAYDFASEIGNLSVIVESNIRAHHIPFAEFFSYYIDGVGKITETEAMYYYYYYGDSVTPYYCFDGESLLLSALTYVTDNDLPTVYFLSGHATNEVTSNAATMFKSLGVTPKALSLSSGTSVPADCDLLIIGAPESDLTTAEVTLLCQYLDKGGAILLTTSPEISTLPNLGALTAYMSLIGEDGIVVDDDAQYYYDKSYPYYLTPMGGDHPITAKASSVLLPFAHPITVSDNASATVTPLLTTSEKAFVLPLDSASPEKPEGVETAIFCVGAVSEQANGGRLIWISCTNLISDAANEISAGVNATFLGSVMTWACGESKVAPTAPVHPLVTETLAVSETTAILLSFILTLAMPIGIVALGIVHTIRRKRR